MAEQEYKNEQSIEAGAPSKSWEQAQPSSSDPAFNIQARMMTGTPGPKAVTSSVNEPQKTSENDGPKR